jgi:hypothetical protein
MCRWISVKAVSFGVAVGLGRKLSKASAGAGDGDALGCRSPPWRRLHQALPFSTSRHEDNYDLLVMGALCFGMGDLLVRDILGVVPLQQWRRSLRRAHALFLV